MNGVVLEAPAKVNLRLRVMAREDDGYHQLETVFQALEFGDRVRVRPTGAGVHLDVSGPEPCPPEENLAYRAARAYLDRTGIRQGVEILLEKSVPAGGGLGGGSSDAASALRALNALFEGELAPPELARLAAELGADVPFFLSPSPLALAWGRGDRILPMTPLPRAAVLLALPPVSVSTPEAFRALGRWRAEQSRPRPAGLVDPDAWSSWAGAAAMAENEFEEPVFGLHPELASLHRALAGTGPAIHLLSGSGAALFALYSGPEARDRAARALAAAHPEVAWVSTSTRGAMPEPATAGGADPPPPGP